MEEEINYYRENTTGKYRAHALPDNELAVSALADEVTRRLNLLNDLRLAQRIGKATDADAEAITILSQEETQAQNVRRLAMEISVNDPGLEIPPASEDRTDREEYPSNLMRLSMSSPLTMDNDGGHNDEAGPSIPHSQRQAEAVEGILDSEIRCCVCLDTSFSGFVHRLKCGDTYCGGCLTSLFQKATTDESLFPPKCCGVLIPLASVQEEMSEQDLARFKDAQIEFSTQDRTYCSHTNCGKFIPPNNIHGDRAVCPSCRSITCQMCKRAYHDKEDCPSDTALQATLSLGSRMGWQRCYACKTLVELNTGCWHIVCTCNAQFCYRCGRAWKSCWCSELEPRDEEADLVDRDLIPPPRVAGPDEYLRNIDGCLHWWPLQRIARHGRDPLVCDRCGSIFRVFLLQCRLCNLAVCQDCQRSLNNRRGRLGSLR
ncbi:hypothetical protein BJX61DRAFT_17351 [Aspergillus egyptiacus]|nr:hypothetical protein BJX61DRAFT_17351 [Aspergillus egyptiacus]